jgi:carbohydrate-binding DOMON domain-containing protein
MDSATHSHYTQKTGSALLDSIMPIMFALPTGPEAGCGNSMTTSTGSVVFGPMNIEMPPLYFQISGPKSMPYLKNGE